MDEEDGVEENSVPLQGSALWVADGQKGWQWSFCKYLLHGPVQFYSISLESVVNSPPSCLGTFALLWVYWTCIWHHRIYIIKNGKTSSKYCNGIKGLKTELKLNASQMPAIKCRTGWSTLTKVYCKIWLMHLDDNKIQFCMIEAVYSMWNNFSEN